MPMPPIRTAYPVVVDAGGVAPPQGSASAARRPGAARGVLAALTAAGLLLGAAAGATPQGWGPGARRVDPEVVAQASRISLEQAVVRVQRATGGRVLDARDEGEQHRVKVLTRQGEVRVVIVDARTGAMR